MEGVWQGEGAWGYGTMSWAGLWTHHISLSSPLWASATSPSSAATSALCSPGAVANENLKIIATAADADDDDKSKAAHEINEMFLALLAQSCCRYDYCYYWCHCPPPAISYPHHLWTVATTMHATQLCATKKEAISRHQNNNNEQFLLPQSTLWPYVQFVYCCCCIRNLRLFGYWQQIAGGKFIVLGSQTFEF